MYIYSGTLGVRIERFARPADYVVFLITRRTALY